MRTRQLGKDGPEVSVVCLGAMELGGRMGEIPVEQAVRATHAAIDAGVTFIDTAESYATSEQVLGRALEGRRDQVFLATKLSGDQSKEHIHEAIENSLRALRTDHVDLYQLHRPKPQWPIEETLGELLKLRDQGVIRHIGLSNFSAAQTAEAARHAPIRSHQPRYSLLFREAEDELLPHCRDAGIGVMVYAPLAKGLLTGKYRPGHVFAEDDSRRDHRSFADENGRKAFEVCERLRPWAADHGHSLADLAIAWTLANDAVTSAIVGAKTAEQAVANAAAGDWALSDSDLAEIEEITGGVRLTD